MAPRPLHVPGDPPRSTSRDAPRDAPKDTRCSLFAERYLSAVRGGGDCPAGAATKGVDLIKNLVTDDCGIDCSSSSGYCSSSSSTHSLPRPARTRKSPARTEAVLKELPRVAVETRRVTSPRRSKAALAALSVDESTAQSVRGVRGQLCVPDRMTESLVAVGSAPAGRGGESLLRSRQLSESCSTLPRTSPRSPRSGRACESRAAPRPARLLSPWNKAEPPAEVPAAPTSPRLCRPSEFSPSAARSKSSPPEHVVGSLSVLRPVLPAGSTGAVLPANSQPRSVASSWRTRSPAVVAPEEAPVTVREKINASSSWRGRSLTKATVVADQPNSVSAPWRQRSPAPAPADREDGDPHPTDMRTTKTAPFMSRSFASTLPRVRPDALELEPPPSPTCRRTWRSCERESELRAAPAAPAAPQGPRGTADKPLSVSARYTGAPAAAPAPAPPPPGAGEAAKWNTLPRRSGKTRSESEQQPGPGPLPSDAVSRMYALPSWYKQNRELKRRSTAILQKVVQAQPDGALLDLLADETDAAEAAKDEDDLEDLRATVKRLSGEVARLQSELNSARLQEFEAQEAAVTASAELDESRRAQNELAELRALKENMAAAASLVQKEVAVLRQQCEQERKAARRMKSEADHAVKERNVMAHQSSLLAEALSQDDRLLPILAEVENLKRLLEEERCRTRELQAGPRGVDGGEEADERTDVVELLDERLKIAEEELRSAANRADRAERENSELRERLSHFEKELEDRRTAAPPPPPPPPMAPPMPPPPPPPPLPTLSPGGGGGGVGSVKLRSRVASGGSGGSGGSSATGSSEDLVNAERNAVQDMANLLGIPRKPQMPEAIPGGAIDNIINQIKGGRFTLKATEQNLQKEKKEEPPPAVTEMLNILGTLRRRPRAAAKPTEVSEAPRDVAL